MCDVSERPLVYSASTDFIRLYILCNVNYCRNSPLQASFITYP